MLLVGVVGVAVTPFAERSLHWMAQICFVHFPASPQVIYDREFDQCGKDKGRAGAHPNVDGLKKGFYRFV